MLHIFCILCKRAQFYYLLQVPDTVVFTFVELILSK